MIDFEDNLEEAQIRPRPNRLAKKINIGRIFKKNRNDNRRIEKTNYYRGGTKWKLKLKIVIILIIQKSE